MGSRGVLWCTAVLVVAVGFGCGGDKPNGGGDTPTLDGSVWNEDGGFVDLMTDSDGDGVSDFLERANGDVDSDGDGILDHQDPDDDGDGIPSSAEREMDSDNDGVMNYLDADDDNDGKSTRDELAANGGVAKDTDGDGTPDHIDDDRLVEVDGGVEKECAQSNAVANLRKKPVDIVFIIDNSSSMDSEIQAVQHSINQDFARIIGMSEIDFRVIMLADFGHFDGAARSVCINGDLNPGQSCPTAVMDPVYAAAPKTSDRFFHYDADGATHDKATSVDSKNSMCRALEWFRKPDGFGLAPNGWSQWLRKDAAKVFVEITDDRSECSINLGGTIGMFTVNDNSSSDPQLIATKFDQTLRALSAEQFGTEQARNYVFHSIIAVNFKAGMMNAPYEPTEPAATTSDSDNICASGENPGRAYEAMSRMTGGLRYPICAADPAAGGNTSGFTAIFQRIAQGVVEGTKVACDFAVPAAPVGKTLDRETVEVVYTQTSADPISFRRVQDTEGCAGQNGSFYFRNDSIVLCADTCARVQADSKAKVDVRFGCKLPPRTDVPPPPPPPPVPE